MRRLEIRRVVVNWQHGAFPDARARRRCPVLCEPREAESMISSSKTRDWRYSFRRLQVLRNLHKSFVDST